MTIQLGQIAPDFEHDSTQGRIRFHEWLAIPGVSSSAIRRTTPLYARPSSPVARLKGEWEKRGVEPIGLSVDPAESRKGWVKDIEENPGPIPEFPGIGGRRPQGVRSLRHDPSLRRPGGYRTYRVRH